MKTPTTRITEVNAHNRAEVRAVLVDNGIRTRTMSDDDMLTAYNQLVQDVTPDAVELKEQEPAPVEPAQPAEPAPAQPAQPDMQAAFAALQQLFTQNQPQPQIDEAQLIALIQKHANQTHTVHVQHPTATSTINDAHPLLPSLITYLQTGHHVYLKGPAGSGKTTLAEQAAKALDKPFLHNGALLAKFELTGFIDASGTYHRTPFRDAYENGGVYLFDEIDASIPQAITALNQALANGHYAFPDSIVKRHPDFIAIAAANTAGTGATAQYSSRTALDGASLDRFTTLTVEYSPSVEKQMITQAWAANGGDPDADTPVYIYDLTIEIRKNLDTHKLQHIVSPRTSQQLAALLARKIPLAQALDSTMFKHATKEQKNAITPNGSLAVLESSLTEHA